MPFEERFDLSHRLNSFLGLPQEQGVVGILFNVGIVSYEEDLNGEDVTH